jgi:hypothetical protein
MESIARNGLPASKTESRLMVDRRSFCFSIGGMLVLSRGAFPAIKRAGGTPRYTEYAGAGHVIWERVSPNQTWRHGSGRKRECHESRAQPA